MITITGSPTPDEIAAVTAILVVRGSRPPHRPARTSGWAGVWREAQTTNRSRDVEFHVV